MKILRGKITKLIDQDKDYFVRELMELTENTSTKRKQLSNVETKLKELLNEEGKLNQQQKSLEHESLMIEKEMEQKKANDKKYLEIIDRVNNVMSVSIDCTCINTSNNWHKALQLVKGKIRIEQEALDKHNKEFQDEDKKMQEEIDGYRTEVAKMQENIQNSKTQYKKYLSDLSVVKTKCTALKGNSERCKLATANIKALDDAIEEHSMKYKLNEGKQIYDKCRENISHLEERFRSIDEQLTYLNSLGQIFTELNIRREELQNREQEIIRIKGKIDEYLKLIYPREQIMYDDLLNQLLNTTNNVNGTLVAAKNEMIALKTQDQRLVINKSTLEKEIQKDKDDIQNYSQVIRNECHNVQYNTLLEEYQMSVKEKQSNLTEKKSLDIYCHK